MSNDLKSIHDFDFTMICNYFKLLERQGPGSPEVTQKAVSFINELSEEAKIADIGCGTGGQTMVLANYTKGQITGIDLFPDFIEIFNRNIIFFIISDYYISIYVIIFFWILIKFFVIIRILFF